jgi:hypothetical protein
MRVSAAHPSLVTSAERAHILDVVARRSFHAVIGIGIPDANPVVNHCTHRAILAILMRAHLYLNRSFLETLDLRYCHVYG